MRAILLIPLLLASLLFVAPPARSAPDQAELGLWDCVARAVRLHPQVRAGRARVSQAGAQVALDRTAFHPELNVSAGYTGQSYVPEIPIPGRPIRLGDHDEALVSLESGYLLQDWGKRERRLEGDLSLRQAGEQSLQAVRAQVALEAGHGYLRLLGARRGEAIARDEVAIAGEHLRQLEALHGQEMLTKDEVLKGRVYLERSRIELVRAEHAVRLARARLLQVTVLPLDSPVEFADTLAAVPVGFEGEGELERALARRPELEAYASRLRALEAAEAALAGDRHPQVSLFASGHYGRPGPDQFRNDWLAYARAGVRAEWNFWDWGRQDLGRQQLRARQEELRAETGAYRRNIALELEEAVLRQSEAGQRLELSGLALESAREQFRVVSARFEQAQVTHTEYLDALSELTAAGFQEASARVDLAQAGWQRAYVNGELAGELRARWPGLAVELGNEDQFSPEELR